MRTFSRSHALTFSSYLMPSHLTPSSPRALSYGRSPSRPASPPPPPPPSSGEIWLPECGLAKDGMWHCALTANMLIAWSGFEDHGSGIRWYDVCTGTNSSACDPEALILRSRIAACLKCCPPFVTTGVWGSFHTKP